MRTVKTAISLDAGLFRAADELAGALHISRSRLVAIAVEEYLRRHQNVALLERLNEAYGDADGEEDRRRVRGMRRHHTAVVADET